MAKGDDDEDEWEPDEDDLMGEEMEDLDDEFDLDDVESSVTGTNEDEYDEEGVQPGGLVFSYPDWATECCYYVGRRPCQEEEDEEEAVERRLVESITHELARTA